MDELYEEISPEQFFLTYVQERTTPPSRYNFDILPFKDLSPKRFEHLCLKYAWSVHGSSNCTLYGHPGQNQHGLDILVNTDRRKYILYQCKHVEAFSAGDLRAALHKFRRGKWFSKTDQFILFSSNSLIETGFIDELENQKNIFGLENVTLMKMGEAEIMETLKTLPAIVDEFFGREWVKHFNISPWKEDYIKGVAPPIPKKEYTRLPEYIPRRLQEAEGNNAAYGVGTARPQMLKNYVDGCHQTNAPARTIICSVAGMGKSKEIENLAFDYSNAENRFYPVIVRLKNYKNDLNGLINNFYEHWREIPKERLLMLFDGLDEVANIYQDSFIRDFNLFLQAFSRSNIIATARSNYAIGWMGIGIDKGNILQRQVLLPLTVPDVHEYLYKRFDNIKSISLFLEAVETKKLSALSSNPFYLKNLVDIFLENEPSFPTDRADAIVKIIKLKIKQDAAKYGLQIEKFQAYVLLAKKLAVFLIFTGRNSIELKKISPFCEIDSGELRYCSLFGLEVNDGITTIYFEHSNFQEYLAAAYLSELDWGQLMNILFHKPVYDTLLPRLINTTNYLFTLLDSESSPFKLLCQKLIEHNNEVLLGFDKDKIGFAVRIEVFKTIIETGKKEEIYYLRSNYKPVELLDFIEYGREGLMYLLEELENGTTTDLHRECLLELLLFFKTQHITYSLRKRLYENLKVIIKKKHEPPVYDIAIEVMSKHGFNSVADIRFIIADCPGRDEPMVRGALIKMIRKAQKITFFSFAIASAPILFEKDDAIISGHRSEFLLLILEFLDSSNLLRLAQFFLGQIELVANILDNISSEDRTIIDKIYSKLADLSVATKNDRVYDYLIKLINHDVYYHTESVWGHPAIFFIASGNRERAFFEIVKNSNNLKFGFAVYAELVDDGIIDSIHGLYVRHELDQTSINSLKTLLAYHKKTELHDYLIKKFPEAYFKDFSSKAAYDLDIHLKKRQDGDFKLLRNKGFFLKAVKELYDYVANIKGADGIFGWLDLTNEEKAKYKQVMANSLIVKIVERKKITGGINSFLNWFAQNYEDWNWFVFHYLRVYLMEERLKLPDDHMEFMRNYALSTLVPAVDFRNPFTQTSDGRPAFVPKANTIKALFLEGYIDPPQSVLLDMLSFDTGGFSRRHHDTQLKDRLFKLVYDKIIIKDHYKERILANLKRGFTIYRVLESHCSACVFYYYQEAIPFISAYLKKRTVPTDIKRSLVKTLIELDADVLIFNDLLQSTNCIIDDWHLDIFEEIIENRFKGLSSNQKAHFFALAERSVKKPGTGTLLQWKIIKMALELGLPWAVDRLFLFLSKNKEWADFSGVAIEHFSLSPDYEPSKIIDQCFLLLAGILNTSNNRNSRLEIFLNQLIMQTAINDYEIMLYAGMKYEEFIGQFRKIDTSIVYLRWYKKDLIKGYYLKMSQFEDEQKVLERINLINSSLGYD